MTEEEWLACAVPGPMWDFLERTGRQRKLRLVASACCRGIWHLLTDERSRLAVEAAEHFADGEMDEAALASANALACAPVTFAWDPGFRPAQAATCVSAPKPSRLVLVNARWALARALGESIRTDGEFMKVGCAEFCDLIREVCGNPFRPLPLLSPAVLAWNDGCVVKLATGIYEEREFTPERMGVLADALEEAGCTDTEIFAHCRQAGKHVRGCWLVDLLTGRA